ncbi:MAG: hypothetical protein NT026_01400, partial [Candidatus Staskawiczbacteria bacterium]|nr:hypothetical protein [Candidatus Staskawiczbacteria bacterium]
MNVKKIVQGVLLSLVFILFFAALISGAEGVGLKTMLASVSDNSNIAAEKSNLPQRKEQSEEPNINAKSAISVFINSSGQQEILFSKNDEERLPIASLTKLMTALVVLDNYDLSQKVVIN